MASDKENKNLKTYTCSLQLYFVFGLGFGEILVVLLLLLVFVGPEKIPETARALGKWYHELRHAMDGVKSAFEEDLKTKNKPTSTPPLSAEEKKPSHSNIQES